MPRARKKRCIYLDTNARYFKPRGVPLEHLEIIRLTFEELEAIRLKDLLGLEQTNASDKMGISQPTFHRILKEARNKVSEALVNSKAIEIFGGDYEKGNNQLMCLKCHHLWEKDISSEELDITCPRCKGSEFETLHNCNRQCENKLS